MTPIFTGTVQGRKLQLDNREQFYAHLHSLESKRVEVTVERFKQQKRSNQQNKWYRGSVLQLIAEHTGEDPENLHEALKAHFAPKQGQTVGTGGVECFNTGPARGKAMTPSPWPLREFGKGLMGARLPSAKIV